MGSMQIRRFGVPVLDRFLAQCQIRRVPSKTTVISGGETSGSLYVIVDGSVAVISEDEDGHEMVVAYLNRGEFLAKWACSRTRPPAVPGCARAKPACSAKSATRNSASWRAAIRICCSHSPASCGPPQGHHSQGARSGVPRCGRAHRAQLTGFVRAAGCHDASPGHAGPCEPPGAWPPRRLLTRNGRTRAEIAGGTVADFSFGKTIVVFGVRPGNSKPAPLASRLQHRK